MLTLVFILSVARFVPREQDLWGGPWRSWRLIRGAWPCPDGCVQAFSLGRQLGAVNQLARIVSGSVRGCLHFVLLLRGHCQLDGCRCWMPRPGHDFHGRAFDAQPSVAARPRAHAGGLGHGLFLLWRGCPCRDCLCRFDSHGGAPLRMVSGAVTQARRWNNPVQCRGAGAGTAGMAHRGASS